MQVVKNQLCVFFFCNSNQKTQNIVATCVITIIPRVRVGYETVDSKRGT